MKAEFVVRLHGTFLMDFSEFWSRWHMERFYARRYESREEADAVAKRFEADVVEIVNAYS